MGNIKLFYGNSVIVRVDGIVCPKNETWYWYNDWGTTSSPSVDQKPTRIEISYTLGKSIISAGSNTYQVTINVLVYASKYIEAKIDAYIKTNVTTRTTDLAKLQSYYSISSLFSL